MKSAEFLLLAGADLEELPAPDKDALTYFCEHNSPKLALWAVGKSDSCVYGTALNVAASYNSMEVARALLASGVGACAARSQGVATDSCPKGGDHQTALRPALHTALIYGDKMTEILLEHIPDVSVDEKDSTGNTLLHRAAFAESILAAQWLLRKGANPRARNCNGEEPLCNVFNGLRKVNDEVRVEFVALLLSAGADPNCEDTSGNRPLHMAVKKGMMLTTQHLLNAVDASSRHTVDINARNKYGQTALHLTKDEQMIKSLLARGCDLHITNNEGCTALHQAVRSDNVAVLKVLLEHTSCLDDTNTNGRTELDTAVAGWRDDHISRVITDNKESAQGTEDVSLTRTNIHVQEPSGTVGVNVRDKLGRTALHWAVERNLVQGVEVLLKHGSDCNVKDHEGKLPLHLVWRPEVVALLLRGAPHTVDVNARDKCGRTPLHAAGQDWNALEAVEALLAHGADPDVTDEEQSSLFHYAAISGYVELVEILLKYEASTDVRDENGRSVLHVATERIYEDIVKTLLDRGADVRAVDNMGRSALEYLPEVGDWLSPRRASVKALLERAVAARGGSAPEQG